MTARDEHGAVVAALRMVRDAWQWKGWSDVLIPDATSNPIANGQRVTEWLNAQIVDALADQPTPTQAGRDETAALRAVEALCAELTEEADAHSERLMEFEDGYCEGMRDTVRRFAALASGAPTAGEAES